MKNIRFKAFDFNDTRKSFFAIAAAAIFFASIMGLAMGSWPAVDSDTVSYFEMTAGVQSMFSGLFPPLYPLALKLLNAYGAEDLWKISFFNAACFVISITLLWRIHRYFLEPRAAFFTTLFVPICVVLIEPFMFALSEPLFVVALLLSVFFWLEWGKNQTKGAGIGAVIIVSFLPLIRLAGVGFIPMVPLGYIAFQKTNKRVYETAFFLFAATAVPFLVLTLLQYFLEHRFHQRVWDFSLGLSLEKWIDYPKVFQTIVPFRLTISFWGWCLAAAFWSLALWGVLKKQKPLWVLCAGIFIYYLFIFVYQTLTGALTPIDWRIMLPAHIFLPLLFSSGLEEITGESVKKVLRLVICIFIFFSLVNYSRFCFRWFNHDDSSLVFRNDEVIKWIRSYSEPLKIYSTNSDVVSFLTRKSVFPLLNGELKIDELQKIKEEIENGKVIALLFKRNVGLRSVSEPSLRVALGVPQEFDGVLIWKRKDWAGN